MSDPPLAIPSAVSAVVERLEEAGHAAYLVGRCLREMAGGSAPADFEIATAAPADALLQQFPNAVVTSADGLVTLPTAVGPVDLRALPEPGGIEEALRRRDFRIHACAYRPAQRSWIDPFEGRDDLARGRLRTPTPAAECFAEDPVRALRAARLVAELGLAVSVEVETAMREIAPAFEKQGGRRARIEIDALLMGPHAGAALALLARTRITASLAPGAVPDAAAIVPRIPLDLELRWAAWLRGGPVRASLAKLRCPRDRATRVERLLQLHPVEAGPRAVREARARRLARRPESERAALLALREAELSLGPGDPVARRRLDHLLSCLGRALRADAQARRRATLALGGREVMARLGCGPGARVGQALRFLTERIESDPTQNEPETLRALLDAWARDGTPTPP